ncbi:MAG: geranylgeranylglycerol-phosphate geranylgeranyltransferase [Euryarchaeota archaeon]|nr:MAG: Digeranylgeranylglyceryl phosphate synthase [ANME-2 cluster archaeon]MEA1866035.1 geranylgeranylglycerol-phosphate geranylgeranyltransferase [Euryarchaeota archaeon]
MIGLFRIGNCVMAGFAAVIGAGIVCGMTGLPIPGTLLLFSSVFLITGAGNAINDFFDADIDAINKPTRPIPSGRVNRNAALYLSLLLFGIGILLSSAIGTICLVIAIANSVLLIAYAHSLKRTVLAGNLCIGYLTGSTFLFGGALFGFPGITRTSGLFALAVLATVAREIAKDIEDVDGDSALELVTLPISVGIERAGHVASIFGMIAVLLSPLPYFAGFSVWYLIVVLFADLSFLAAILRLRQGDFAGSSKLFKAGMAIALAAFVAGAGTGTVSGMPIASL